MIVTHKIAMDLSGYSPLQSAIQVMQDDKYSREIAFHLYANSVAVDLGGCTAIVRYCKADGTGGNYDLMPDGSAAYTIAGNVVKVKLAPQVLTAPGAVKLAVGLIQGNAQVHTFTIDILVQENPGLQATSENYYKVAGTLADSGWTPNMYLGTDANGNVVVKEGPEGGGGSDSVELDTTLTQAGKAAEARAVGDALSKIPVAVTEDGYTEISGLRQMVSGKMTREGQTITITSAWDGGETHTDVITLDENDYPKQITVDGRVIPWEVEGF